MTELSAQEKLDKLDKQNRMRVTRYLENQRKKGKKQISGLITEQAYDELSRRRQAAKQAGKAINTGQILTKALLEPSLPESYQAIIEHLQATHDLTRMEALEHILDGYLKAVDRS